MKASFFLSLLALSAGAALRAQPASSSAASSAPPPATGSVAQLPAVHVVGGSAFAETFSLPAEAAGVTASAAAATVNLVDVEDAVKYLPSLFLRKRNYGDTQPTIGSRVWGVSSSARSLVYADDVLLSALVANNNTIGAPRWGLVSAAEIERIDVMYGPFSAAYPGNSMGVVMVITTRQPDKFTVSVDQVFAAQTFSLYGTRRTFGTAQTSVTAGERRGRLSVWLSASRQDSRSQPLTYVTASAAPAGTTGAYAEADKLGRPEAILGAGGLLHTRMTNATLRAAWDFTPTLRLAYTVGLWQNAADAEAQTFLRDGTGQPTFAGAAGFASGTYGLLEDHSMQSLSLRTAAGGDWDFDASVSDYRMDRDNQRQPAAAGPGATFGAAGRVAVLGGTGWNTLELKGGWHPAGRAGAEALTFGLHQDAERLHNPTFATPDWRAGGPYSSVITEGDGRTRTQAAWAQEEWRLAPGLTATAGLRYEEWRAAEGLNVSGATTVRQPEREADGLSPKATLAWQASPAWRFTASYGQAFRYPTVGELYQLVSTGSTFTSPDPDLKPDDVRATELRADRALGRGHLRLSLFQDDVRDAILSQYAPLVAGASTLYSYTSNVDRVRARGVELELDQEDVFVPGLQLSGSATWLDARILADRGQGATGSAVGNRLPNIPEWRFTVVATYRPGPRWSFTAAGRYSGKLFTSVDNVDVHPNTYQGFAPWFVADLRVQDRLAPRWTASAGVDNVLDRKYFLFHPFPQRTCVTELKYAF